MPRRGAVAGSRAAQEGESAELGGRLDAGDEDGVTASFLVGRLGAQCRGT